MIILEKINIIKELVRKYFDENSMYVGISNMNVEDKEHVIEIGTSILCTKWEIGFEGGGFVKSVVANDLSGAIGRADGTCIKALKFFCQLSHNVGKPYFETN